MYEINYSIPKKKTENSKFNYKYNQDNNPIYVFELIFTFFDNSNQVLRKIKKGKQNTLISNSDKIEYNKIKTIDITVLNTDNTDDEIKCNVAITNDNSYTIYYSDKIYLELNNIDDYLCCSYNITN